MTAMNPVYTIGFQITEALKVHYPSLTRAKAKARALELLGLVDLPDPAKAFDSYPHQLSGGQRQAVAIARALRWNASVIIMDEPTAALGVAETVQVENIIRTIKQNGEPLILISHNMRQVFDLVDRIVVFRRGRIAANLKKSETSGEEVVAYITGAKTDPSLSDAA
jgi:ABC-type glutathione transport system ATPase component